MYFFMSKSWPWFGWLGIVLVVVFWFTNWFLDGLRTFWGFFPLWLGYILTINAITQVRIGSTLITRNFKAFAGLFLLSAPFWWLFELIDLRTDYWVYLAREQFTDLEYFILASISFSTVLPAVFSTAELVNTWKWLPKVSKGPRIKANQLTAVLFFVLGWLMLIALLIWPQYFPAFLWMSLYFITDPVNYWLGNKNLLQEVHHKDWRTVIALFIGTLICGFFWEMWNIYSYPKWIYQVPFVDFWYVFEMPLLGYLGYLPFGLELYALYHFVINLVGKSKLENYIAFGSS